MAVGDLLCLSAQLSAAKTGSEYNFDYCFEAVKDSISSADLAMGNLETLVADGYPYTPSYSAPASTPGVTPGDDPPADDPPADDPPAGQSAITTSSAGSAAVLPPALESEAPAASSGNPRINAPESFLTAVLGCGFDVLTTANNHIFDYKADGLIKTMQKLDAHGVMYTGSYASHEDKKPLIADVQGINVAILAYTSIINNSPGRDNAWMIDRYDEDLVAADIAAAKEGGADFTIVCVHWGTEHTHKPNSTQRKMAQFIAEAGADIILGSHPHCTQPFEAVETERGAVPVLYSLGNFISSMGQTMHKDGVIVSMELEKEHETGTTTLSSLTYIPTLCASSKAGRYVIYPADLMSITNSADASELQKSRERTIRVLTEDVATSQ
jgi:poly-gamma-glutamate capsule biosynthesis protein CapA/YwtB (metallophosphatase superfamily)